MVNIRQAKWYFVLIVLSGVVLYGVLNTSLIRLVPSVLVVVAVLFNWHKLQSFPSFSFL